MAHENDKQLTPAAREQLKMLLEIVEGGSSSPRLAAAFRATKASTTNSTPSSSAATEALRALRTLPISGYDPSYASACSRIIDALRSGKEEESSTDVQEALSELFDAGAKVEICGFGVTSGTSGAARKLFPQVREAMRRRNEFFLLREPMVAPSECRLNLFVPARPEILNSSSSSASSSSPGGGGEGGGSGSGRDASGDRVLGPATAVIFHAWMTELTDLLLRNRGAGCGGAPDYDPIRREQLSYPLALVAAEGVSVEQRLYLIWLCTLARGGARVVMVVDTFGGSVLSAVRVLRARGEEIAADLRAGRLVNDSLFGSSSSSSSSSSAASPPALAPEVRRAVDLCIGGEPRSEAAEQLEEALRLEKEEDEAAAAGLLARLLPNLRFVSAIFTGSMAKYLPPMRALVAPLDAAIVTEFFGGSEGTYGINEALLLHRGRLGGSGSRSGSGSKPFPPLPEPQRFVALTGSDVFMEFLPLDNSGDASSFNGSSGRGMIDGQEVENNGGDGGEERDTALSVADGPVPPGRYELVVTSFSGLARYRVGDVVRVVGAFEPPPPPESSSEGGGDGGESGESCQSEGEGEGEAEAERERRRADAAKVELLRGSPVFEFVGRAGSALNLVWEKFDEGAILAAVAEAAAAISSCSGGGAGAPWRDFAAREDLSPAGGGAPSYVFYVESSSSSSSSSSRSEEEDAGTCDIQSWADALEASLRSHNAVYEMLIAKGQISPVKVCLVSRGGFDALRESAVASGTAHAQYKTPVVVEADPRQGGRSGLLEARVVGTAQASV